MQGTFKRKTQKPFGLGLLALLGLVASASSLSCGQVTGDPGEADVDESGERKNIRVRTREFLSQTPSSRDALKKRRPSETIPPEDGSVVVWDPPADVPLPPPWEPSSAYLAFKTHCFDCHYQFSSKESALRARTKIKGTILANGSAVPMPPSSRSPNYTTFRNTSDGKAILNWLASAESTPAPVSTAVATATPSDSAYNWEGVNGQDSIRDIVQASCVTGCHVTGGQTPAANRVFDSLTAFKSHVSDVRSQVDSGMMPKAPRTMTTTDRAKLLDYVNHSAELR